MLKRFNEYLQNMFSDKNNETSVDRLEEENTSEKTSNHNYKPTIKDNIERWEELCFMLSQSLPKTVSEQLFEQKVIQVFDKLGWREYKGEITIRESIRVGSANRVEPDIILKTEGKNHVVVEVKKPSVDINYPGFKDQLSSYMRLLKLDFGVLIGAKIQIYIDGSAVGASGLVLIGEFDYNSDNKKGIDFISLFNKQEFTIEALKEYADKKLSKISSDQISKFLLKQFASSDFEEEIKQMIVDKYSDSYEKEIVEMVLSDIQISVRNKNEKKAISSFKNITRKMGSGSTKISTSNNNVLNKRQCLDILENYVRENNIIGLPRIRAFSNITVANVWWIEPRPSVFERDFSIMFNDSNRRYLYVFVIPGDRFNPPTDYFYLREDTNRISIKISIDDISNFRDIRSGTPKSVSFIKYLAHKIKY